MRGLRLTPGAGLVVALGLLSTLGASQASHPWAELKDPIFRAISFSRLTARYRPITAARAAA